MKKNGYFIHCISQYSFLSYRYSTREYLKSIKQQGFSLVEIMITISIIAILAIIAYPSIQSYLKKLEASRMQSMIVSHLKQAKTDSFLHRKNVIVCLANHQGVCDRNSSEMMMLFFDNNANNHFDANDEVIIQERLDLSYGRLYLRAGGRDYTKFWGDSGTPRGFFGHIKYCPLDKNTHLMYQVSFNQTGKVTFKPHSEQVPTDCP